MKTFTKVHERRVEKLARAVEKTRGYNQLYLKHDCGTPACLLGWAQSIFKVKQGAWSSNVRAFLFGKYPADLAEAEIYGRDCFGERGCDNAGRSGKKAAAFIRKMAADLKAAQS